MGQSYPYDCAPMTTGLLPNSADLRKLASQNAEFEASLSISALPRVVEAAADDKGSVSARLAFRRDEQGLYVVDGNLKATVSVICQRCLGPMEYAVDSHFSLGMVWTDEQAKQLPRHLEPLIVDAEPFDVKRIVEDELLLCLPFSPFHPEDECSGGDYSAPAAPRQGEGADAEPQRDNPFKVLEQLKRKDD